MGHGGMLYSLPSRELIADSLSIWSTLTAPTPWSASLTAKNHPGDADGFPAPEYSGDLCSGGPMEAGKTKLSDQIIKLDWLMR